MLHHWFWHFPYQFCSITIFTRMPQGVHPILKEGLRGGGWTSYRPWSFAKTIVIPIYSRKVNSSHFHFPTNGLKKLHTSSENCNALLASIKGYIPTSWKDWEGEGWTWCRPWSFAKTSAILDYSSCKGPAHLDRLQKLLYQAVHLAGS